MGETARTTPAPPEADRRDRVDARNPRVVLLGLAPFGVFAWQYVFTRTLLAGPHGSLSLYYLGRGVLALAVVLALALTVATPASRARRPSGARRGEEGLAPAVAFGALAALAPVALARLAGDPLLAPLLCLAAGMASTWLYLDLFRMFSRMPLRLASAQLLGGLCLSYVVRVACGLMPDAALPWIGVVAAPLCSVVARRGIAWLRSAQHDADAGADAAMGREPAGLGRTYWLFVGEFAVYGFVAGLVRTPYELAQFGQVVSVAGSALLLAATLALLVWVVRTRSEIRLNTLCQVALFLLLTVLLALALFGSASAPAAAVASLFARFGVFTLLLYVLCAFVTQRETHPYVTFGIGWAAFSLATAAGMLVARAAGSTGPSITVILAVAYVLFGVAFVAIRQTRDEDVLFSSGAVLTTPGGSDPETPSPSATSPAASPAAADAVEEPVYAQLMHDVMSRCEEVGLAHGLTRREVEVVQLICVGRSKGYIADAFGIAENTVRGYAKNAYRKLGVHSRQDLLTLMVMVR